MGRVEGDILLFRKEFYCNSTDMPTELQMELVDLQAHWLSKEKLREKSLLNFTVACLMKSF